jgi:hypothetical protein
VLSGIFFDPSETMWTGTAGGAHAAYLGLDSDTQGNWGGKYGTDGYVLVNWMGDGSDLSKLPGYVESLSFNGGYHAYGALPVDPGNVVDHDGTIAPYGAGMGMMFLPGKAVPALKHYFANPDLWRHRFGFGDAYNLDPPDCSGFWYNHVAFGIDQGPMLISIENCRSRLIWETMKRNEYVSQALHSVWRALCVPISGPKTGTANEVYTFTATVSPITVATPITYVWQATGKSPVTHTGGISDTAVFSWGTTGGKAITVTATNAYGTGTGTCVIHICHKLYLPLVLKQG